MPTHNALHYAWRLIDLIGPLICISLIAAFASEFMKLRPLSHHWLWIIGLATHCAYAVRIIITFFTTSDFITQAFYIVLLWDVIIAALIARSHRAISIAKLEIWVAVIPYVICTIWTFCLDQYFVNMINSLQWSFWMQSFEKDWDPESNPWWWRSMGLWSALRTALKMYTKFIDKSPLA
jgi:hypothetical protein